MIQLLAKMSSGEPFIIYLAKKRKLFEKGLDCVKPILQKSWLAWRAYLPFGDQAVSLRDLRNSYVSLYFVKLLPSARRSLSPCKSSLWSFMVESDMSPSPRFLDLVALSYVGFFCSMKGGKISGLPPQNGNFLSPIFMTCSLGHFAQMLRGEVLSPDSALNVSL